ncbi:VOC family protein [Phycicoccus avicenniae]|uniref:VOC family protein n=1 Tax=Phycicoccus avicenniae TaxID=2828860 RepID=UPI003D2D3E66
MALTLFAGVPVTDLAAARDWYGRFLGDRDPFSPNDTELVWDLGEGRSVYVLLRPEHAGYAHLTLLEDERSALERRVATAAAAGIEPTTDETYGNGVRKVTFHDPDGNEVGLGGMPAEDG